MELFGLTVTPAPAAVVNDSARIDSAPRMSMREFRERRRREEQARKEEEDAEKPLLAENPDRTDMGDEPGQDPLVPSDEPKAPARKVQSIADAVSVMFSILQGESVEGFSDDLDMSIPPCDMCQELEEQAFQWWVRLPTHVRARHSWKKGSGGLLIFDPDRLYPVFSACPGHCAEVAVWELNEKCAYELGFKPAVPNTRCCLSVQHEEQQALAWWRASPTDIQRANMWSSTQSGKQVSYGTRLYPLLTYCSSECAQDAEQRLRKVCEEELQMYSGGRVPQTRACEKRDV